MTGQVNVSVERKINFDEITPIIETYNKLLGDMIIYDLNEGEIHFFKKIYETCSDIEKRLIEINWYHVYEEIKKCK